jgi:hypothetical protein
LRPGNSRSSFQKRFARASDRYGKVLHKRGEEDDPIQRYTAKQRAGNLLEGDVLEVAVRNGRWVLTHVSVGPRLTPPPAQHYFLAEG